MSEHKRYFTLILLLAASERTEPLLLNKFEHTKKQLLQRGIWNIRSTFVDNSRRDWVKQNTTRYQTLIGYTADYCMTVVNCFQ